MLCHIIHFSEVAVALQIVSFGNLSLGLPFYDNGFPKVYLGLCPFKNLRRSFAKNSQWLLAADFLQKQKPHRRCWTGSFLYTFPEAATRGVL